MKQIKLGIIGCGGAIAGLHMNNVIAGKCPSVQITAISNRTIQKAYDVAKMLEDNGINVKVYDTDSDLIQNADIDAILINTPHYQHEELAIEAFEKGLHVLSEKPSGAYTLQALRMNEAADKNEYSKNDLTGKTVPKVHIENVPLEGVYTAHGGILESFAREIIDGTPQIADGHDGYFSLSIANALIWSQWQGNKTITMPIDDEAYFKCLQEHYKTK